MVPGAGRPQVCGCTRRPTQVCYDKVNNEGGIKDSTGKSRKINLVVKDDGCDSARTIPLVSTNCCLGCPLPPSRTR
jgi:hypothetical protein